MRCGLCLDQQLAVGVCLNNRFNRSFIFISMEWMRIFVMFTLRYYISKWTDSRSLFFRDFSLNIESIEYWMHLMEIAIFIIFSMVINCIVVSGWENNEKKSWQPKHNLAAWVATNKFLSHVFWSRLPDLKQPSQQQEKRRKKQEEKSCVVCVLTGPNFGAWHKCVQMQ